MVEHKLVKQQRERNKQKAQAVKDLRKLKSEEAKLDAEMEKLTGVNEEDYPNVEPQETSPKATETIITSPQWNTKKYHLIRYQKPSFGLKQMTWVVII